MAPQQSNQSGIRAEQSQTIVVDSEYSYNQDQWIHQMWPHQHTFLCILS